MEPKAIALGAAAFAGVAMGAVLFGPSLEGAEAEPGGPAVSPSPTSGAAVPALTTATSGSLQQPPGERAGTRPARAPERESREDDEEEDE